MRLTSDKKIANIPEYQYLEIPKGKEQAAVALLQKNGFDTDVRDAGNPNDWNAWVGVLVEGENRGPGNLEFMKAMDILDEDPQFEPQIPDSAGVTNYDDPEMPASTWDQEEFL